MSRIPQHRIALATAADERYFPGLIGTVLSALISLREDALLAVTVLDAGIEPESREWFERLLQACSARVTITFEPIDLDFAQRFPDFFFPSKAAYARLLLGALIREDRVLYLDSDILVTRDLTELWATDLGNSSVGAIVDARYPLLKDDCPRWEEYGFPDDAPGLNSGVLLCDLVRCRERQVFERSLRHLAERPDENRFWDQSALNFALHGDWLPLSRDWNHQGNEFGYDPARDLPRLLQNELNFHFVTSHKPWLAWSDNPASRLFRTLLIESGWALPERTRAPNRATQAKQAFRRLLPRYYAGRAALRRRLGQSADADAATAQFWDRENRSRDLYAEQEAAITAWLEQWRTRLHRTFPETTPVPR